MITDGEPTAHITLRGDVFFNYPPVQETVDTVVPLSLRTTSPRDAAELLAQVEAAMTQHGWDPHATAIPVLRQQAMERHLAQRDALLAGALTVDPPGPSL